MNYDALVLAGRRSTGDPLAESRGETHRALLDVAGVPMLARVVRALRAAKCVDRIGVSIDDPDVLGAIAESAGGELIHHQSLDSPSRSVRDALTGPFDVARLLITTADHALLTAEMVDDFVDRADRTAADVAVGLVSEAVVRASYPGTTRTYLRFRDGGFSGANLFAFRTPEAIRAAEFWVSAEQFRKRPWRLASVFGPVALVLFALRRLSLDAALRRASRVIGCRVQAVELPFAEAAIDVDRSADLVLATQILKARE